MKNEDRGTLVLKELEKEFFCSKCGFPTLPNIYKKSGKGILYCSSCGSYIKTATKEDMVLANSQWSREQKSKPSKPSRKMREVFVSRDSDKMALDIVSIANKINQKGLSEEEAVKAVYSWLEKEVEV